MTVKYGKFKLPDEIEVDKASESPKFARLVAAPFERGFGHTVGNALRRIMLNAIEAPAIISVKIEGVRHEYTAIEGVIEDMTHIILNLKGALIRKIPLVENQDTRAPKLVSKTLEVTQEMLDAGGGQFLVKLEHIMDESEFEIVNPDHYLFTITKPMERQISLKIGIGRGYVPSGRHDVTNRTVDEIPIDAGFSPVIGVNYYVENARVGQDTDYDRLVLEVTTDGRVTPQEALSFSTQIGVLHLKIFDELKFQEVTFDTDAVDYDADRQQILSKLSLRIDEIELSVRSTNCLAQANISTIAELVIMPEQKMLGFRNFGKKSLNEIKDKLEEMGLHLGMDLSRFKINHENVKEVVEKYLEGKVEKES